MDATLKELVDEVFAHPTVEGLDLLIGELRPNRGEPGVADVIDDLLDHRFALANAGDASAA
jgi:hypothetical protein